MKFQCDTKHLTEVLGMATAIARKTNTVRIRCEQEDGGVVRLHAHDQSTVCEWVCPAKVQIEGQIVLKGNPLEKFLKASTKSEAVVVVEKSEDKNNPNSIVVRTSKSAHLFDTLPDDVHPNIPVNEIDGPLADLSAFGAALNKASTTIAQAGETSDSRLYFTGVFVKVEGHEIHVVGTDGVQMTYAALLIEGQKGLSVSADPKGHLIPGAMISKIVSILNAGPAKATLQDKKLLVANAHGTLSVPLLDLTFPAYKNFLSIQTQHSLEINKTDLTLALSRCAGTIAEGIRDPMATITAKSDGVHLLSNTSEQSSSEIVRTGTFPDAGFSFKIQNMNRALGNLDSESVHIRFGNSNTPVMVHPPGKSDLMLIFMPLKA